MSEVTSTKLKDGRIRCRVKIIGTYKGKVFEYTDLPDEEGSQFIWPDGEPSEYWWAKGNMSCDCNRVWFLEGDVEKLYPELFQPSDDPYDAPSMLKPKCGNEICIDEIIPLDESLPSLILNETIDGHL